MSNIFDELAGGMFSSLLEQAEKNQQYPSIASLHFTPVPAEKAEGLKQVKVGLFGGGTKKKFIAAIEEGRTTYAEVLALARESVIVRRAKDPRDHLREIYYKVAALDGTVLRESVPAIDKEHAVELAVGDTGCANFVDPGNYPHMFIVNYYLKDDMHIVLLSKEQFDDMAPLMIHAGSFYHHTETGAGYKW